MKALLIDAQAQSVESTDVATLADIRALVGFDTLESDEISGTGDRLFFDEECFIRGTPGRLQIDSMVPVAGKAVVVGTVDGDRVRADVAISAEALRARIRFS